MRLKLRTRVTIAQSIITKVKRSSYVTIGTSLLPKCPAADIIAPLAPWVNILYAVHLYSKRDRLSRFDRILQATVITVTLTYDKTLFESIDL